MWGIGVLESQLSIALFHSAKLSIQNSNIPLIFVYLSMTGESNKPNKSSHVAVYR